MLINAQPSLPITQWERLGQTLLVLSFRTTTELISLLGNLAGLSELSLWVEHQAVAWQVVSHIQVSNKDVIIFTRRAVLFNWSTGLTNLD